MFKSVNFDTPLSLIFRVNADDDVDDTDSDDVASLAGMDARSEVTTRAFIDVSGCGETPILSPISSVAVLGQARPVRERGFSLSVERTPEMLQLAEPRSKSLRLKKQHKDTRK